MDKTKAFPTRYLMRVGFVFMLLFSGTNAYADSSTHNGRGTFYDYFSGGNCSFPPPPTTTLTAAMNKTDYANSAACGGVIEITNKNNGLSVRVRIDDQCPECPQGNVDLDQEAFALIADLATGIIPISWRYVPNTQAGNIKLFFEPSSSRWWTAVQVRDHLYPISKLEYRQSGSGSGYTNVGRQSHNFFIAPQGMGPGPYDFRITDFWGQTVEVSRIPLTTTGATINTGKQFAVYGGTGTTNTGAGGSTGDTGNTGGSTSSTGDTSSSISTSGGGGALGWLTLLLLGSCLLALRRRRWQMTRALSGTDGRQAGRVPLRQNV